MSTERWWRDLETLDRLLEACDRNVRNQHPERRVELRYRPEPGGSWTVCEIDTAIGAAPTGSRVSTSESPIDAAISFLASDGNGQG